jgi:hypothetical protein
VDSNVPFKNNVAKQVQQIESSKGQAFQFPDVAHFWSMANEGDKPNGMEMRMEAFGLPGKSLVLLIQFPRVKN